MSCGKDHDQNTRAASEATNGPAATGEVVEQSSCPKCGKFLTKQGKCRRCDSAESPPEALAHEVSRAVSRDARQKLWEQTVTCPACGGRYAGGEKCPLCAGSGQIAWDNQNIPRRELREQVVSQAGQGTTSDDGYLWLACHFPDLAQSLPVQKMIRTEVTLHPDRALLGYAPDTLIQAGLVELVFEAARQNPGAAGASLRAQEILKGAER